MKYYNLLLKVCFEMDCKFRVLTKDKKTFEKLKNYANGCSENKRIEKDKFIF